MRGSDSTRGSTVTRNDFQRLAESFLDEAQVLFSQGKHGAAYYMAGYAVECALKACIAKLTAQYDFPPPRKDYENCYTHDLERLVKAAGLEDELKSALKGSLDLMSQWTLVKD
jgi:HEPN domain-containing protein